MLDFRNNYLSLNSPKSPSSTATAPAPQQFHNPNHRVHTIHNHQQQTWVGRIDQLSPSADSDTPDTQQKRFMNTLNFIFSFITKTLLQSIKQLSISKTRSKQQETFLAQLLPVFFEGFKSELVVYKQTSYLLCSFLFEKFKFNAETCNKTLFAISKGLSAFRTDETESSLQEDQFSMLNEESLDCAKSAILSICLIVQSQQSLKSQDLLMNKNFLRKLIKSFQGQMSVLIQTIDNLNETYKIESFLHCLFHRCIVDLVSGDQANVEAGKAISLDLDNENNDEVELEAKAKNECSELLLRMINKLNLNRTPGKFLSLFYYIFKYFSKCFLFTQRSH